MSPTVLPGSKHPLGITQRLPLLDVIKQISEFRIGMAPACKILRAFVPMSAPPWTENPLSLKDSTQSMPKSSGFLALSLDCHGFDMLVVHPVSRIPRG